MTGPKSALVLTDGKAGDEKPARALAEGLGCAVSAVRIQPRSFYAMAAPYGPPDPRDWQRLGLGSIVSEQSIDIVIATGRRAVPYLRRLRRAHQGLFTVFLKDPRTGTGSADVIWVPAHDRLRGSNVIVTIAGPHGFRPEALAKLRANPPAQLAELSAPRVAVLIGGDSRKMRFTETVIEELQLRLDRLAATPASLMITTSRRTPQRLVAALEQKFAAAGEHILWTGGNDNPLPAFLANADAIVVTADSANMLGEAAITGKPLLVFHPEGHSAKLAKLVAALEQQGAVFPFDGRLRSGTYDPVDDLPLIVDFIKAFYTARIAKHTSS